MIADLTNALQEELKDPLPLYKTRLVTFCTLVVGTLNARTVNLTHLASAFTNDAETSSNYRRLQRFFQQVHIDFDRLACFIVRFMGIEAGPWMLAIDRTNWKFGQKHINILMLAISYRGVAIPLLWMVLGRAGNSHTQHRTALLKRFCKIFGTDRIAGLTGDREFVGREWMNFLDESTIPFILRLKKSLVVIVNGKEYRLETLLQNLKKGSGRVLYYNCRLKPDDRTGSLKFHLACKRLKNGELLILATNCNPQTVLADYRQRWQIETLFAACKTRGFNLEDTHMTRSIRIKKMLAVLAIAFCWAHRTGEWKAESSPIKDKKHGRKAQSLFRYGFDKLRHLITCNIPEAIRLFRSFLHRTVPVLTGKGAGL